MKDLQMQKKQRSQRQNIRVDKNPGKNGNRGEPDCDNLSIASKSSIIEDPMVV